MATDSRSALIEALRYDLIGPMRPDEVIDQRPTRWYLAGFLVPKGTAAVDATDPTDDENLSAEPASDAEDDAGDAATPAPKAWFPSSCGLSVIVDGDVETVDVTLSWGEYRQLTNLETVALWQKHRPEEYRSRYAEEERPADAVPDDGLPDDAPSRRRRPPSPLWQRTHYALQAQPVALRTGPQRIAGAPGLVLRLEVRHANAPGLPPGARTVSIFLVNERPPGEGARADEGAIFQVEVGVVVANGLLSRTALHQQDSEDFDEQRVDLQYRDHGEWVVGHNVAVCARKEDDGSVRMVHTTWLPEADVYRMRAREVSGVPVAMADLAALGSPNALAAGIEPMIQAYMAWIARQRLAGSGISGKRGEMADALSRAAERATERIRDAIAFLSNDPKAWRAFILANRAMDLAARAARPERYVDGRRPEWRLFQLAFFLLNLRGIGDPRAHDREVVELLFFPTGGGKTEAYLGVAAFALVLRRLRGLSEAHEGGGVSVLLRYTLRMLTLDQLGRAATLVCALETIRRELGNELGSRRFQVGLWVGKSATPNRIEEAERQLTFYKANPNDRRRAPPMPLHECPWCRTPFGVSSYAIRWEGGQKVLRVGCVAETCAFHFDHSEDRGVPVVVVDEQIYRELPAFLIATVDKFAGLPRTAVASTLFGRVRAKDDHGFYSDVNAPAGATRFAKGLPPLDLVLQDELHLITGPLGTMVGLYETMVGELSRDAGGARPKLIASTATARGAGRQVQALYGARLVEIFPPPGLNPSDTFFAENETDAGAARRYVGVAAPGRNIKALSVRVHSALLSAAYREWRRGTKEGNPADTYMTVLSYFNTLRELGGAQRLMQEEVAPRCARLSERRAFQDEGSGVFSNRTLAFDPLELTSRQSTDQIRHATARLRAPYQSDVGGRNDVALASSMISVGVDIPRLGLMVMNGQPRTVAEYIQATSRVGRETPGLVVTLFNLRRPRDRSHYERFTAFHECFYRMVESASVTPFSGRALDRGLAGVVIALARHLFSALNGPKAAQDIDRVAGLSARLEAVLRERVGAHAEHVPPRLAEQVAARVVGLLNDWSQISAALRREQVPLVYSSWEVKGGVPLLSTAVDPPSDKHPRLVRFRAPTSMRDVESGVHIWTVNSIGAEDT